MCHTPLSARTHASAEALELLMHQARSLPDPMLHYYLGGILLRCLLGLELVARSDAVLASMMPDTEHDGDQLPCGVLSNIGLTLLTHGLHARAARWLESACAILEARGEREVCSLNLLNLSTAYAHLGDWGQARISAVRAQAMMRRGDAMSPVDILPYTVAWRALIEEHDGDRAGALYLLEEARSLESDDPHVIRLVDWLARWLDDARDTPALRQELADIDDELAELLGAPVYELAVSADSTRIRLDDGPVVDLRRRTPMRRILVALVHHHRQAPGDTLSALELIEAGWPGDKANWESLRARLYTTILRLRQLGLGPTLVTADDGYGLVEDLAIVELSDTPPRR